jgi:hypothetical protein
LGFTVPLPKGKKRHIPIKNHKIRGFPLTDGHFFSKFYFNFNIGVFMTKTNRFLFLAGVSLATALTLSCSDGKFSEWLGDLTNGFTTEFANITKSNLLQNNRLGFMSTEDGVPDGEVDVITNVQINGTALSGGSTSITVTSSEELEELYLQIEGEEGYYRWELEPEDQISSNPFIYQIVLEFNQSLGEGDEGDSPTFIVSGKTKRGEVVEPVEEKLIVKQVGSGALQISLSWDMEDDVDLYVFTPSGEKLFWNYPKSFDGKGELDVDANGGCDIDMPLINSENIYFKAPLDDGDYKVVAHLYAKCARAKVDGARYNVTANVKGKFVNFGGKNQSGQFVDAAQGDNIALNTLPTNSTANVRVIGTIRIENGEYVE